VCRRTKAGSHAPQVQPRGHDRQDARHADVLGREKRRRSRSGAKSCSRLRVVDAATHRAEQAIRRRARRDPPAATSKDRGPAWTSENVRSPQPLPHAVPTIAAASFSMLSPSRIVTSCRGTGRRLRNAVAAATSGGETNGAEHELPPPGESGDREVRHPGDRRSRQHVSRPVDRTGFALVAWRRTGRCGNQRASLDTCCS